MGWSIKKPFGGKKSIFNQVAKVTGVGTIAALSAQTLGLKTAASSINENAGMLSEKKLDSWGKTGQIVGATIAGGYLLGSLAPAAQPAARYNMITNTSYTTQPSTSFITRAYQGVKAVGSWAGNLISKAAGAAALLAPKSGPGGGADPTTGAQNVLPGYENNIYNPLAENENPVLESSQPGGPAGYQDATAGGGWVLPVVVFGLAIAVLYKKFK